MHIKNSVHRVISRCQYHEMVLVGTQHNLMRYWSSTKVMSWHRPHGVNCSPSIPRKLLSHNRHIDMKNSVDIGKEPLCRFMARVNQKVWDCVEVVPTFLLMGAYKGNMGLYSHLCVDGGDGSDV